MQVNFIALSAVLISVVLAAPITRIDCVYLRRRRYLRSVRKAVRCGGFLDQRMAAHASVPSANVMAECEK